MDTEVNTVHKTVLNMYNSYYILSYATQIVEDAMNIFLEKATYRRIYETYYYFTDQRGNTDKMKVYCKMDGTAKSVNADLTAEQFAAKYSKFEISCGMSTRRLI